MEILAKEKRAAKAFARLGGLKGGKARADALTAEQRSEISRSAATVRWAREKHLTEERDIPKASHSGALPLGDVSIPCAVIKVLKDGRQVPIRVLSENGITNALLGSRSGASKRRKRASQKQGAPVPLFLAPERLSTFISDGLLDGPLKPIIYRVGKSVEVGFDAQILPIVCDIWLKARDAGALQDQQLDKAKKAELLMRGLAHVGIVALVDEATGYQADRDRDELHKILEAYISKELLPWTRKFPPEFYKQLFRLQGWQYSPLSVRRPRNVAQLTIRIVYDKLPPGVYEALTEKNPIIKDGRRRYKLFRHMTEDIGQKHLEMHLASVTTLMRISPDWRTFKNLLEKAFPTPNKPIQEEIEYGDEFSSDVIDIEALTATEE